MKINDIPQNLRPREKLLEIGANNLSTAELLAIFLRIGNKNKNAIELGADILHTYGGLRGLYDVSPIELLNFRGLGKAKVAQLLATIELNKRYLEENLIDRHIISDSKMMFDYLYSSMRDLKFEIFKVICLDSNNQINSIKDMFKGSLAENAIYPRDIVKFAIENNAIAIICVHNHPSGNIQPSEADKLLTKKLIQGCDFMGISFYDHIIIGNNKYFSFQDENLL